MYSVHITPTLYIIPHSLFPPRNVFFPHPSLSSQPGHPVSVLARNWLFTSCFLRRRRQPTEKMRASQLLSTLALTATAALAGRSTQHVGNFVKRLERAGRSPPVVEPLVVKRENQHEHAKRANTTTLFLTNSTASKLHDCCPQFSSLASIQLCGQLGANPLQTEFSVDGTAIPEVDFDVGESYAGSIPVTTEEAGDNLFFWFFPSTNEAADKEILIWLNGGVRHLIELSRELTLT